MAVKVTYVNDGLVELIKRLKEIGSLVLTIGFQGASAAVEYENGPNVATVALYNEFGTKSIPGRAFLRSTMFEQRSTITEIMGEAVGRVTGGTLVESAGVFSPLGSLSQAGREIVALVEDKIRRSRGWAKGNRQSTIAKKGFDYPLHETGVLQDSVTWAVRRGSAQGPILAEGGAI